MNYDKIYRKISINLNIPEYIVERVMNHQFEMVKKKTHDFNEVEISNFATLKVREKQVERLFEKYTTLYIKYSLELIEAHSESRIITISKKLNTAKDYIEHLKKKLDEDKIKGIMGRVEESFNSKRRIKGANNEGEAEARIDMSELSQYIYSK